MRPMKPDQSTGTAPRHIGDWLADQANRAPSQTAASSTVVAHQDDASRVQSIFPFGDLPPGGWSFAPPKPGGDPGNGMPYSADVGMGKVVGIKIDPATGGLTLAFVADDATATFQPVIGQKNKRVLVLLTDMTAYADAMKEVGVAQEKIPATRGYMGDLYTQLAKRYEKACDFKGAGSVTILAVTTMPGGDVTHPVPDNTGYITEGQFYLHDGVIDPFGSLSRLKQHVVGRVTREDHGQIMNTMVRFYSNAKEAEQKQQMSFELSDFDHKLLKFGKLFYDRFMRIEVSMPLDKALDLAWQTLAECFEPQELLMKQELIDRYYPSRQATNPGESELTAAEVPASGAG